MPSTSRQRQDSTAWYPAAEAAWAIVAVLVVFLLPGVLVDPLAAGPLTPLAMAVIVPAPFFLTIRIVAGIADMKAGHL